MNVSNQEVQKQNTSACQCPWLEILDRLSSREPKNNPRLLLVENSIVMSKTLIIMTAVAQIVWLIEVS